jgi:hypothetical protein
MPGACKSIDFDARSMKSLDIDAWSMQINGFACPRHQNPLICILQASISNDFMLLASKSIDLHAPGIRIH